jgi:hypothetical protein
MVSTVEDRFAYPEVLLFGDLASHTMLIHEQSVDDGANKKDAPYRAYQRGPKEPLLPTMIRHALQQGREVDEKDLRILPDYSHLHPALLQTCGERISVLDVFPGGSSSRRGARSRLRVKQEYVAAPWSTVTPPDPATTSKLFGYLLSDLVSLEVRAPRILVIYDQDAFTRQAILNCAEGSAGWLNLRRIVKSASHGIVIGINGDLFKNGWLAKIASLLRADGEDAGSPVRRSDVVVQVSADCLRKAGLSITKYGALEESVKDIFDCRGNSPMKELLALARHLVIVFRETGSLHIDQTDGANTAAELHFCPNFDRIAQSDEATYGEVPGKFAIFIVSLVKELYRTALTSNRPFDDWNIANSLRLAAVAYNLLFADGLRQERGTPSPFLAIEQALSRDRVARMFHNSENSENREYLVSSLALTESELSTWSRTSRFLTDAAAHEFEPVRNVVKRGLDATLVIEEPSARGGTAKETALAQPWFPRKYITVPYAIFKKLKLLDQSEIVKYYSLAKIIRKYIQTAAWSTPLSIAVFGPPGSGKSFGVKQILETVDPGRKSEPLTFNLAQFSSVEQLTDAFHQIQDRALSSDEVPLAIFDEFDAQFGTWRGWLKYFLAPMQDGLFRGRSSDYRVGRAIFLFSGGTSDSFSDFMKPPPPEAAAPQTLPADALRIAKVSDFASRLRGFLDVADINEPEDAATGGPSPAVSPLVKLRRAVILRSLLEQHAAPIFVSYSNGVRRARIHPAVIDAFLEQPRYQHGVRSMEAIIQMSRWVDGEFVAASLPLQEQLKVHVGADFLPRLVVADDKPSAAHRTE